MTSATPAAPSTTPPDWPHCGHSATAEDPVGCRGSHVPGHTACLAHVAEPERSAYLATLAPGDDLDHCGTSFTAELLDRLLDALLDPATGSPCFGNVRFDEATFTGAAWFDGATFTGVAGFDQVTFASIAEFSEATFTGAAWFIGATFTSVAGFDGVAFASTAQFSWTTFAGMAWFEGVAFAGTAEFTGATFTGAVRFVGAQFETPARLGPLVCGGTVVLDGAVFGQPAMVEAAARGVTCARTRWASAATLRLRHAELDLTDAVLEYPLTVAARSTPFTSSGDSLPETPLSGSDPGVRLTSVDGVDAAHLVLHDIDLSSCRLAGAVHLDQLRVDGWCTFATTPTGVRRQWLFPRWWSLRSTLAEEHHWRARRPHPTAARGWTPPPREDTPVLNPAALAALYRQLRKSLEDAEVERMG